MNLFLAAVYGNNYMPGQKNYVVDFSDNERAIIDSLPNILESYHYVFKPQFVEAMRNCGTKVFLDSGAFSAFTLGVSIDLPTYCTYIKENIDILRVEDGIVMASVLDGIGDAQKTYENQLAMEALGAKPLPCFHFGEDPRYLTWYVGNYDYITIGGMVGKPVETLMPWLDQMWENHLTDGSGAAKLKVHAFGITSKRIMERYPWHSVDSSTWIQNTSFGKIVEPTHGPLSISPKSPSRHVIGQHVSNLVTLNTITL